MRLLAVDMLETLLKKWASENGALNRNQRQMIKCSKERKFDYFS